jgi:Uncharacterized protein conserved in bacteria (DUF2188)
MRHSRYVILHQDSGWKVVRAGRRPSGSYGSKTQAMIAAITFAEEDGRSGHDVEVLVRDEDGRFMREWMLGCDAHGTVGPSIIPPKA